MESKYVAPVTFTEKELLGHTHHFMSQGKHTPDDILESSTFLDREIFYVPTHFFRGSYVANWTASFGYDRKEAYTAYRTVDGRQEAYTAYRTVTDWRPASGTDSGNFAVKAYAGPEIDENAKRVVEGADLSRLSDLDTKYLSGFPVREFSKTADQAYAERGEGQVNEVISRGVRSHAQGDHQKDWHWTAQTEKVDETLILPVARSVFEYSGQKYTIWFDGTNAQSSLSDGMPVDKARKRAVALSFIPFWASLAAILVTSQIVAQPQSWALSLMTLVSVAALVFGFVRRHTILKYSRGRRDALLLQKTAENSSNNDLSEEQLATLASSYTTPVVPKLARTGKDKSLIPGLAAAAIVAIVALGVVPNLVSMSPAADAQQAQASDSPSPSTDPVPEVMPSDAPAVTADSSWVPSPFIQYEGDPNLAWKSAPETNNCLDGACFVVDVALNEDCASDVLVEAEITDSAGNSLGLVPGSLGSPAAAGSQVQILLSGPQDGLSALVKKLVCK
jgi:hypothetical protein